MLNAELPFRFNKYSSDWCKRFSAEISSDENERYFLNKRCINFLEECVCRLMHNLSIYSKEKNRISFYRFLYTCMLIFMNNMRIIFNYVVFDYIIAILY